MSELTISQVKERGVVVLAPEGRIDSATAKSFETATLELIEAGETRIAIDLEQIDYISSAGLRVVLLAGKRLKTAGGVLTLCNLKPSIREVFEISGFIGLFAVSDSREAAIDAAQ